MSGFPSAWESRRAGRSEHGLTAAETRLRNQRAGIERRRSPGEATTNLTTPDDRLGGGVRSRSRFVADFEGTGRLGGKYKFALPGGLKATLTEKEAVDVVATLAHGGGPILLHWKKTKASVPPLQRDEQVSLTPSADNPSSFFAVKISLIVANFVAVADAYTKTGRRSAATSHTRTCTGKMSGQIVLTPK